MPALSIFKSTFFSKSNTCHIKIKCLSPELSYSVEERSIGEKLSNTQKRDALYHNQIPAGNAIILSSLSLCEGAMGSSRLGVAGGLNTLDRSLLSVGDVQGLKDTREGGAEELAV